MHRGLGVHVSKVRSLTLDAFEPEILKVMAELGNATVNRTYEANVVEVVAPRATPDCAISCRENWIRAKYIAKAFIRNDLLASASVSSTGSLLPAADSCRKWTVKRLRRRARRTVKSSEKPSSNDNPDDDKDSISEMPRIDVIGAEGSLARECGFLLDDGENYPEGSRLSIKGDDDDDDAAESVVNAEILLFGGSLGKHHVANIQVRN